MPNETPDQRAFRWWTELVLNGHAIIPIPTGASMTGTVRDVEREHKAAVHRLLDALSVIARGVLPSAITMTPREARALVAELNARHTEVVTGPGSTEDERKALAQLLAIISTEYPQATGLSHAMGLVLKDAAQWRAEQQY